MVFGRVLCSKIKVLEWRNECDFVLQNNLDVWRVYVPDFICKIEDEIHMLNKAEIAKSQAFLMEEDRNRYLVGKIYLRKLIGAYVQIAPDKIEFGFGKFKKPFLTNFPTLNFNVSHSGDFVIIAFSNRWAVGVDVEVMNTKDDLYSMIQNTMSTVEAHVILNSGAPRDMFYKHWTRKEALLKCIGVGLTDDLKSFSVCDGLNLVPSELSGFTSTLNIRDFLMDDEYCVSIAYDSSIRVIRFYQLERT